MLRFLKAFTVQEARAVLFDFNGVLVDDEAFHWRAFAAALAAAGVALPRARYDDRYLAFDDLTAARAMLRDAGLPAAGAVRLVRRKRRIFRRTTAGTVRVDPAVAALVRRLAARVPLAIVSGAARIEVRRGIERARLARCFRTIVAAEQVRRSKPDPEGYLLALRRLGIEGGRGCVAIEDSPGGIAAARAAGLRVIGIATSYPAARLRRAGARPVVASLARLSARAILAAASAAP